MNKAAVLIAFFFALCARADTAALRYYENAVSNYKNSEIDKAKTELLKSLEYDNSNQDAAKLLVEIEEEKFSGREGEYNETAREFYEKGLVLYRKGDAAGAEAEWRKALKISPDNGQIKKFLARVAPQDASLKENRPSRKDLARQKAPVGEEKQEKKAAKKEARVSPEKKQADDLYYEGLRLYKQGKVDEAVSCWEQVLKIDPDNQKASKAKFERCVMDVKAKNKIKK